MAVSEFLSNEITLEVSSLRKQLDNAECLEQIKEVVIEVGTLVGEDRMPELIARFLVCHAQTQLTSLKNKQ